MLAAAVGAGIVDQDAPHNYGCITGERCRGDRMAAHWRGRDGEVWKAQPTEPAA